MFLLGSLPVLLWIGLGVALIQRSSIRSFRESILAAGVNTALWALAGAELLSLFHALSFWPLLIWWTVPVAILACLCWRGPRLSFPPLPCDPILLAALAVIGLFLLFTLLSGLLAAPSNWDALSYHLPRQVYWMQQRHVGFFSTGDARMLTMPPLAEYISVQLMILAGGDYWAHSVQWVAYGLCAVSVSLVARDVGLNARWQALTAMLALSIPTAALQASNAKNDLVTAFLLCALAYLGLQILRSEKLSLGLSWHLGVTGGLLLLSKGTGMMFGFPAAMWIIAALLIKHGPREALRASAVAVVLAAALTAGFFSRAYVSSDSPRAKGKGMYYVALRNQAFTPQAFISNVLRNTSMHVATDNLRIDAGISAALSGLHRFIGIDLNDPRTTYPPSPRYRTELRLDNEDRAKAPIQVLLAIPAFGLVAARLFRRNDTHQRMISFFLLLPFLAFFTFCFVLSWQVWHSRLHIPVLCLLSPVIVLAISDKAPRALIAVCSIAAVLGLYATLFNSSKPLIGKFSIITSARQRSSMQPDAGFKAAHAVATICKPLKPKVIGLAVQSGQCEYTLLRTLLRNLDPDPQFAKLNVSWRKPGPVPVPDLLVSWYIPKERLSEINISKYSLILSTNAVQVYVPNTNATSNQTAVTPRGSASD